MNKAEYEAQKKKRIENGEWDCECPYCASDATFYDETLTAGEVEWWYCAACKKGFEVDIEVKRLRARKEESDE